jgi:hypothetical protein
VCFSQLTLVLSRSALSSSLVLICSDTTPNARMPSQASPPTMLRQQEAHSQTTFTGTANYQNATSTVKNSPKTSGELTGYPICGVSLSAPLFSSLRSQLI